jgi:predicted dehydrogenase
MRALVVGLGSIGRRHARNWAALGLGEVLVCRQTQRPLPAPLGIDVREFNALDEALEARPEVVLVTNPTSMHLETACRAVAAGAHVLVEKPLSHTLDGVNRLLDTERVVMVGYNLRFHPGLGRLRSLVHGGAIGRPVSVRAEVGEYLPDWHPWEDYRSSYSARKALGGGPLLTFSHELDTVYWLFGLPNGVTAVARHVSQLEIDTEDVAEVILDYAAGPLVSVHVDYVRRPTRRTLEVVGEEGVLRWEYDANRVLRYAPATREWTIEEGDPRFERNEMFTAELRDLVGRIEQHASGVGADARQGVAVLSIALAALRSSAEGRRIEVHGG